MLDKIKKIRHLLSLDKSTKRFIQHNQNIWSEFLVKDAEGEILTDLYSVPETLVAYSYFLNVLAKKQNAKIVSFSKSPRIRFHLYHRIYHSMNCRGHVRVNEKFNSLQCDQIYREIWPSIKTKRDLLDLKILGLEIGIDIYESYLRYFNKPTVDLKDPKLQILVKQSIGMILFWKQYISSHNVKAIVVSHDCYIHLNIPCKLGYALNIPVYLPNARGMTYAAKPFALYTYFSEIPKMFQQLSASSKTEKISMAKQKLDSRLGGKIGVDMSYATKSAYHNNFSQKPLLEKTNRFKVLICSHCFFDNPHVYGRILFEDFYEWLSYLGELAERTNYDWYIKMHPDPLPGTAEVLESIAKKYPRLKILPVNASHHQLIQEGINFILTAYGSVGHEYPALGIPVMNAGYNPHIAYNFNYHPKTIQEYEELLMQLPKLKKPEKNDDIYEFYYMHYYHVFVDKFIFSSHRDMTEKLTARAQASSELYDYFLNQQTPERHESIISEIGAFLDSGTTHYFNAESK